MLCCSSCSLPIQGHQLPMGARCSILFNKASHASGLEQECTVCLQALGQSLPGQAYPQELQVPPATILGGHSHRQPGPSRGWRHPLQACMDYTWRSQVIKAQLCQLTELVWQLLPQPGQATPQSADAGNMPPVSSTSRGSSSGYPWGKSWHSPSILVAP